MSLSSQLDKLIDSSPDRHAWLDELAAYATRLANSQEYGEHKLVSRGIVLRVTISPACCPFIVISN
jgi:hypothetical protein